MEEPDVETEPPHALGQLPGGTSSTPIYDASQVAMQSPTLTARRIRASSEGESPFKVYDNSVGFIEACRRRRVLCIKANTFATGVSSLPSGHVHSVQLFDLQSKCAGAPCALGIGIRNFSIREK